MKRPKALHYAGKPGDHIRGIPARDLTDADIRGLTDEQLADATANHPRTGKALYREPKPKAEKPAPADAPADRVAADVPSAPVAAPEPS